MIAVSGLFASAVVASRDYMLSQERVFCRAMAA